MADLPSTITDKDIIPDFSRLRPGLLSDLNVVVREEMRRDSQVLDQSPKAKRTRYSSASQVMAAGAVVPAHRLVLWSLSSFFQAKVCAANCNHNQLVAMRNGPHGRD